MRTSKEGKKNRHGRIITILVLAMSMLLSNMNVFAISDGDTSRFTVDDSHNNTGGFVIFEVDDYKGSCIQKGTPYSSSGSASMDKRRNTTLLAKAAYYVDEVKGWYGNNTDRPAIMDRAGVASRFRAGLLAEDIVQCANQGTDRWSQIALGQTYPQAYVDYVVDLVENTIPDVDVPPNFILYKGSPSDNSQDFAVWKLEPISYCYVQKKLDTSKTINDSSQYSLSGAVYYVYTNEGCTTRAKDIEDNDIALTTNASGITNKAKIAPGTYWVKEHSASAGCKLDTTAHKVTVTKNNDSDNPAVVNSTEPPDTGWAYLVKKAQQTDTNFLTEAPNNYSLAGAKYELYTAAGARAKDVNGNNITLTTKADGTTDKVEVSFGSYYAKEVATSVPKGFKIDSNNLPVRVTKDNTSSNPAKIESTEPPVHAPFEFNFRKVDISGNHGYKKLLGTEYTISYYDVDMGYGNDAPTASTIEGKAPKRTWTYKTVTKTDDNGQPYAGFDTAVDSPIEGSSAFYTVNGKKVLPRGVFTVEETKAASGMSKDKNVYYCRVFQSAIGSDAATVFDAALSSYGDGASLTLNLEDDEQHPVIEIQKKDADTEEAAPQGADRDFVKGSLAGAEYAVYYDDPAQAEPQRVGTIVTDENGYGKLEKRTEGNETFIGDWLPLGRYYIEEVKAPDGYTPDALYYENGDDYKDGQHILMARAQTGNEESFAYTVESLEKPHHTYISKREIGEDGKPGSEELPGATLQLFDSEGNMIEEWVSTNEPHDIVALHDETQGLKDGKYTLRAKRQGENGG